MSAKPRVRAPSLASSTKRSYFGRMGGRDRVPAAPGLEELGGIVALAITRESSPRSWQSFPGGQYLPLP